MEEAGEEPNFDQLFTLRPDIVVEAPAADEEEDEKGGKKKGGKKKGKKHVEIEYDPDAGRTFAKKKHKRGGDEFEW